MKLRIIFGDILIFLTLAFTVYLSIIMSQRINTVVLRDDYLELFQYELIACAVFLLFALDLRFGFFTMMKPKALKAIGWILRIAVCCLAAVLLFFFGKICVGSRMNTAAPAKNVIVLGMALEDGEPTDDLLFRLDTAEKYLRENPNSVAILTGGNPDETGKTEAAVMLELLCGRGIAEERMILEDQADSTKTNFRYAAQLIDPGEPAVLISSDYHMDRAVQTAKSAGFTNILRLPAPSSPLAFGVNVMGEVINELNDLTLKK